ncbi:hypothetical protein GEMRC1_002779 [Eukaryota sp. GEM-RC1]
MRSPKHLFPLLFLVVFLAYKSAHNQRHSLHDPIVAHSTETLFSEGRAFDFLMRLKTEVDLRVLGTSKSTSAVEWILKEIAMIQTLYPDAHIMYQTVDGNGTQNSLHVPDQKIWSNLRNVIVCLSPLNDSCSPHLGYAAHFDSVSTMFGALDDASGTILMLELLRSFAADPPSKAISFVFTNGEEMGLLGSSVVKTHPWAQPSAGFINLDCSAGKTAPAVWFVSSSSGPLPKCLTKSGVDLRPWISPLTFGRTDGSQFVDAGVNVIELGILDDMSYYHTPVDDVFNLIPGQIQSFGDYAHDIGRCVLDDDSEAQQPSPFCCASKFFGISIVFAQLAPLVIALLLLVINIGLIMTYKKVTLSPAFAENGWFRWLLPLFGPVIVALIGHLIHPTILVSVAPHFSYFIYTTIGIIIFVLTHKRSQFDMASLDVAMTAFILSFLGCLAIPFIFISFISTTHSSFLLYIYIRSHYRTGRKDYDGSHEQTVSY